MKDAKPIPASVDEYIAQFSPEVQAMLNNIRAIIQAAVPEATERICYGMPTFYLHRNLVHFAAYKTHIGFYPGPDTIEAFAKELTAFKLSKGTVRFRLAPALPYDLITRMTAYTVEHNTKPSKG